MSNQVAVDNFASAEEFFELKETFIDFMGGLDLIGIRERLSFDVKAFYLEMLRDKVVAFNLFNIASNTDELNTKLQNEKCLFVSINNESELAELIKENAIDLDFFGLENGLPVLLPVTQLFFDVIGKFKTYLIDCKRFSEGLFPENEEVISDASKQFLGKLNESFLLFAGESLQESNIFFVLT